jgi:hypothetical protein
MICENLSFSVTYGVLGANRNRELTGKYQEANRDIANKKEGFWKSFRTPYLREVVTATTGGVLLYQIRADALTR